MRDELSGGNKGLRIGVVQGLPVPIVVAMGNEASPFLVVKQFVIHSMSVAADEG